MGRSFIVIAGALILLSVGATGAVMWNDSVDPDAPLLPTFRKCGTIVDGRGPTTTDAKIRRFDIGGIHLGMSAADALNRLRSISQLVYVRPAKSVAMPAQAVGKMAWAELAVASNPKTGSLGRHALGSTTIRLGSTTWPDGTERITSITYNATLPDTQHPSMSDPKFDFSREVIAEVANTLGDPTVQAHHSCLIDPYVAWGRSTHLDRLYSVRAYAVCRSIGGASMDPDFQCDRRQAIKTPFVYLIAHPRDFFLQITDGEQSYASRYPAGYSKSYLEQLR